MYAPLYDIDPSAFGKIVMLNGKPHTITGLTPRRSISPISLEDAQGRKYKCKLDPIQKAYPLATPKSSVKPGKVVEAKTAKCKYCGRPDDAYTIKINVGACHRKGCVLKSMRDNL